MLKTRSWVARHRIALMATPALCAALALLSNSFAQILGKADLNVGRHGHTATPLTNGKILIVGGENATGAVADAEIFDPASRTLAVVAGLAVARTDHTATPLSDGRVLIAGGRNTAALDSTEIFDAAAGAFSAGPSLTRARAGHSATVLADGKVLLVGGDAEGTAETLDPVTQLFTPVVARLGGRRAFHGATLLQDRKVLIAGGTSPNGTKLASAEIFDPVTLTFSATANAMKVARVRATLRVLPDGKVQVIGGETASTMEIFDPAAKSFGANARVLTSSSPLSDVLGTASRGAVIQPVNPDDTELTAQLDSEELYELVDRGERSLTEVPSANQALVAGGVDSAKRVVGSAFVVASSPATITTDKTDYAPGDVVTITGAGWGAGETVGMVLHEEPITHGETQLSSVADSSGSFTNSDYAPEEHDGGVTYTATAKGQASGFTAQTSFSDGVPTRIRTSTMSPSEGACGATITAQATLERKPGASFVPSAGKTVTFTLGSSTGSGTTNSSGVATATLTVPSGATQLTAAFAADATDNATSASISFTVTGSCCGDGTVGSGEECDLGAGNGQAGACCTSSCTFVTAASNTVCRAASGACDEAETCSGTSATCPADQFKPSSTVCRAADGECDLAESCSGSTAQCPNDTVKAGNTACSDDGEACTRDVCDGTAKQCTHPAGNTGTVCRAASGPCDIDETCNGTSSSCPADQFKPSSTVCRAADGECDVAENCSGSGAQCPNDAVKATNAACSDDGQTCTRDVCDGAGKQCTHPAGNAGVVCRAAAGFCDVDETCNGTSSTCPANQFKPSSTVCRAADGECDVAENCSGSGAQCPTDAVKATNAACSDDGETCTRDVCDGAGKQCTHPAGNAGIVCRAAAGFCDVDDVCNGTSPTCPANQFKPSSTVCRAADGECDVTENCTGADADCPADAVKPVDMACTDDGETCTRDVCDGSAKQCTHPAGNAGVLCRAAAGFCDVDEVCNGTNPACPGDQFKPSSTVCRAASGECDVTENCTGAGADCPTDAVKQVDTACTDDGEICTRDVCDGSGKQCTHPAGNAGMVCRAAAGFCDVDEACNGTSPTCPSNQFKSSTTVCRAADGECDVTENCTGSTANCPNDAVQQANAACSDDGEICTRDVCDGNGKQCTHPAGNAGSVCRPAAGVCDITDVCNGTEGHCPADLKSTAVCRVAAGDCDVTETCDGQGNDCPANAFEPSGTACGSQADSQCDHPDTCNGAGSCLANYAAAGTFCGDAASECLAQDTCSGSGACTDNGGLCTVGNFLPPVDSGSTFERKRNSSLPFKFQVLHAGTQTPVSDATATSLLPYLLLKLSGPVSPCAITSPSDTIPSEESTNKLGLTYDADQNQFVYVWSTKNRSLGCYNEQAQLGVNSNGPVAGNETSQVRLR